VREVGDDFRASRVKLPPEAFALWEGPDSPPSDLIDEQAWRGITSLPDDVSLRTSDHYGTDLKRAYRAWGDWVSLALAAQYLDGDPPKTDTPIVVASFVVTDELQSSLYSALCGFYRASLGDLRLALEGAVAGLYFTAIPDPQTLQAWEEGGYELKMNDARQRLAQHDPCRRYPGLMGNHEWVASSLRQLNTFSHGKPSTANIEFWEGSNGPIYVPRSFEVWRRAFVDVVLLSVLLTALAEPRLREATYPSDFRLSDVVESLLSWHPQPPAASRDIQRDLT
jgi:hypothetical protein